MYGRSEPHQLRLQHQGQAAFLILSVIGVGVFLSVNHIHFWSLVITEAILAGAGSLFPDKVGLKPNGPFFGFLALGTCASIPAAIPGMPPCSSLPRLRLSRYWSALADG